MNNMILRSKIYDTVPLPYPRELTPREQAQGLPEMAVLA